MLPTIISLPLLFPLVFSATLVAVALAERVLHVVLALFMSVIVADDDDRSAYPAMQALGAIFGVGAAVVSGVLRGVSSSVQSLASLLLWWLVIFLLSVVVFMLYEESPQVTRDVVVLWNTWLGPVFHFRVVTPLRLLQLAVEHVLPVWNAVLGTLGRAFSTVLVTGVFQTGVHVLTLFETAGTIVSRLVQACVAYALAVQERVYECDRMGDTCFEPVVLDLVPAGQLLPRATGALMSVVFGMCPVLRAPADLAVYPLTDPNLPLLAQRGVNAALFLVVETPRITSQRCRRHGADEGIMMCLPDVRRIFDEAMAAARSLGALLDNWLDVALVIVENAVNSGDAPACDAVDKRVSALEFSAELFGSNNTAVVGVSGSLFALTDGVLIEYVDAGGSAENVVAPFGTGWPIEVDVSLGVAVVSLGSGADSRRGDGTGLLGCRCDDSEGVMKVTCAVAPHFESTTESIAPQVFEAGFQVPSTARYMTCAASKISVQSVRWPATRYTTLDPDAELVAEGRVDAAVWVMPLCGTAGAFPAVCLGGEVPRVPGDIVFKDAACFPYCMALHERGSVNQDLILFSSREWEEYVHLLGRDCTMAASVAAGQLPSNSVRPGGLLGVGSAATFVANSLFKDKRAAEVTEWDGRGCSASPQAVSLVPLARHAAYAGSVNSVRMAGQPFVFAGDTAVVGEYNDGAGEYAVTVYRLFGNSRSEYTLTRIVGSAPANPPLELLADFGVPVPAERDANERRFVDVEEPLYYSEGRLTLPYRFASTGFAPNPAVQTRDGSVFFAINPTLSVFTALFEWCGNTRDLPRTQLMVLTKYAPIQITRLRFSQQANSVEAQSIAIPGSMTEVFRVNGNVSCTSQFSLAVTGLELVDDVNIVATVAIATLASAATLGPGTRYRLAYVHPVTLQFRWDEPWEPVLPRQPSDGSVRVCPGMRRMPNLGSLVAEGAVAGLALARFVPELVLGFVGMVPVWRARGAECPLLNRGHTALQRCGGEMLSQDAFFRAVYNANRHFWRSLSFLAEFVVTPSAPVAREVASGVKNALHGLHFFGAGLMRPFLLGNQQRIVSALQAPLMEQLSSVSRGMMQISPNSLLATARATLGNPIGIAWYTTRLVGDIIMDVIPPAIKGDAGGALRSIWVNVYDSRGSFAVLVLDDAYMGCAGLSMMIGYNNPWAELLRHLCEFPLKTAEGVLNFASALLVDVAFTGCLCQRSAGRDFYEHAMEECYTNAPRHLQPMIIDWLQFGLADSQAVCASMRGVMQANLKSAMQPAFETLHAAAAAIGGSIDYLRVAVDGSAGRCTDFENDPFVVALLPEPVDYFRACGATSLCEQRCGAEIAEFEAMADGALSGGFDSFEQEVQSLFFVDDTDPASRAPFRVVLSLLEIACADVGGEGQPCVGRCVAVFGVNWDGLGAGVRRFCVPSAPGLGVRLASEWAVRGSPGVAAWALGRVAARDASAVVVVSASATLHIATAAAPTLRAWSGLRAPAGLEQVTRLLLYAGVVVMSVVTRAPGVGTRLRDLCGTCDAALAACEVSDCEERLVQALRGHYAVFLAADELLLLPSSPAIDAQPVSLLRLTQSVTVASVQALGSTRSFTADAGVAEFYTILFQQEQQPELPQRRELAQNGARDGRGGFRVFSTERPDALADWLVDVAVSAQLSVARRTSQPVTIRVDVEKRCERLSCAGCRSLAVQRACYAMQQCLVARCVGTFVNQNRPLCAIGQTVQHMFAFAVESMQAVWLVGTETVGNVVGLGFGDLDVEVTWPDDAFFSLLCVTKDATATAVSTFTSTIHNFAQTALSLPLDSMPARVDGNLRAVLSLALTAMNNLLFQTALLPLYIPLVIQRVVVCETNSLMIFTNVVGLNVTIGHAGIQAAIGSSIGQCLPERTAVDVTNIKGLGATQAIGIVAGELLATLEHSATNLALSSITTVGDAAIAWLVGVITGMQDVVQTIDMAHCKMPDFYMSDVYRCACGDTAVSIAPERRAETYVDSAFWCSGTLRMLTDLGEERIVFNRHSMDALSAAMAAQDLDRYLLCVARPDEFRERYPRDARAGCEKLRPQLRDIESQGVQTIAVWGRCKANYNLKEWDPGAYAAYDPKASRGALNSHMRGAFDAENGRCLLAAHARGEGPDGCLRLFLQARGVSKDVYFAYRPAPEQGSSVWTDACHVFSGPAARSSRSVFRECLDEYEDEGCEIAPFVWNARSSNRVPVATAHVLEYDSAADRRRIAEAMHAQAHSLVTGALESVRDYENDRLAAYIFSAEGDFLHQLFDCAVMGALGRVDLWPRGELSALEVPAWWRSEDGRGVPECRGADLDDNVPPFTCGSATRRGVMRDFVRRHFNSGDGGTGGRMTSQLVRDKVAQLLDLWEDQSRYACDCPGDGHGLECCADDDDDDTRFTPEHLRTGSSFDTVPSQAVAALLGTQVATYWRTLQTRREPWWEFLTERARASLRWAEDPDAAATAADAGLLGVARPLLKFDASEVSGPFAGGTESLWQTCTGLLAQPVSTLPLAENASGWFVADVDAQPFARGAAGEAAFVDAVLARAEVSSPLGAFRSLRHAPSRSAVCQRRGRARPLRGSLTLGPLTVGPEQVVGTVAGQGALHGARAFKLGAVDCACGWYHATDAALCEVPQALCNVIGDKLRAALPGLCDSTRTYAVDSASDAAVRAQLAHVTDAQWEADVPCPLLAFSDHWGVTTAGAGWATEAGAPTTMQLNSVQVLLQGRGGLRVGSWARLTDATRARKVHEGRRRGRLFDAASGEDLASQPFCMDEGVAPADVDERRLVPAAQIVLDSVPVAACSKYVVEAVRLRLLLASSETASGLATALAEISAQRWERRCKNQLHLLSTCEHFGVFEVRPDAAQVPATSCPFTVNIQAEPFEHYVTSGCVVYLRAADAFFDPCRCYACDSTPLPSFTAAQLLADPACRLRVDPRSLAQGWGAGVPQSFVDDVVARLQEDEAQTEGAAAGDAKATCDGIVDWWPDAWSEPVGFHVTAPCHPSEAEGSYRVFDNAFVVQRGAADSSASVNYVHTALRSPQYFSVNFGTCGLCRRSNYGLPLFDINTVRACTMRSVDETFDPLVPRAATAGTAMLPEQCADSSRDVPWIANDPPLPTEVAVGVLPMWDGGATFPSSAGRQRMLAAGVRGSAETAPSFRTRPGCAVDADCVRIHGSTNPSLTLRCRFGVCQPSSVQCHQHSECNAGAGEVCSGLGTCVASRVDFVSRNVSDVEWQVFADHCGPTSLSFDARGSSPWGQISRVLEAHGMCGYHEWFDYRSKFQALCPGFGCSSTNLPLTDMWPVSSLHAADATVEAQQLLTVEPHVCDRDYHTRFARACYPAGSGAPRGLTYRTFEGSPVMAAPLMRMPEAASSPGLGFLSLNITDPEWRATDFQRCDNVFLCATLPFTFGFVREQRLRPVNVETAGLFGLGRSQYMDYEDGHVFMCGASMFVRPGDGKCVADPLVVPFYRQLCRRQTPNTAYAACLPLLDTRKLSAACLQLSGVREPYTVHQHKAHEWHNKMFGVFKPFEQTFAAYLDAVKCGEALADTSVILPYQSSGNTEKSLTGVYYAFPYSLYEVPFSWWFKCSLLAGVDLSAAAQQVSLECPGWDRQSQLPPSDATDWFDVILRTRRVPSGLDDARDLNQARSNAETLVNQIRSDAVTLGSTGYRQCKVSNTYGTHNAPAVIANGVWNCLQSDDPYSAVCTALNHPQNAGRINMFNAPGTMWWTEQNMFEPLLTYTDRFVPTAVHGSLFDFPFTQANNRLFPTYSIEFVELTDIDYQNLAAFTFLEQRCETVQPPRLEFDTYLSAPYVLLYGRSSLEVERLDPRMIDAVGRNWYPATRLQSDTGWGSGKCTNTVNGVNSVSEWGMREHQYDSFYLCAKSDPDSIGVDLLHVSADKSDAYRQGILRVVSALKEAKGLTNVYPDNDAIRVLVPETLCWIPEKYQQPSRDSARGSFADLLLQVDTVRGDTGWLGFAGSGGSTPQAVATSWSNWFEDTYSVTRMSGSLCQRRLPTYSELAQHVQFQMRTQIDNKMCAGVYDCEYCGISCWQSRGGRISSWSVSQPDEVRFAPASSSPIQTLQQADEYIRHYGNTRYYDFDVQVQWGDSSIFWDFFGQIASASAWRFDASANERHHRFLLRDPQGTVLCKDGSSDGGFDSCHFDDWMTSLYQHVQNNYRESSFVRGASATFRSLRLAAAPHVLAWAAAATREAFVEGLLDGSVCALGEQGSSVCFGPDAVPVNPWVGGDFNALVGCDTEKPSLFTETVDRACDASTCSADFAANIQSPFCLQHGIPIQGQARHTDRAPNNLCWLSRIPAQPADGFCAHAQGQLGSGRGRPINGSLYAAAPGSACNPSTLHMYVRGVSPIFRNEPFVEDACLQFDATEIGPAALRFALGTDGELRVDRVRLHPTAGSYDAVVGDWVAALEGGMLADDAEYAKVYDGTNDALWSAPLQRVAFWGGRHALGAPMVPDPSRAARLFGHIGLAASASPVQRAGRMTPAPAALFTSNGYCMCSTADACAGSSLPTECTLIDSLRALVDGNYRQVRYVVPSPSVATPDWPHARGTLRDGLDTGVSVPAALIADRLPPFFVRFRGDFDVTDGPAGATTLSEGGDCHMGRAVDATGHNLEQNGCRLVALTATTARFRCTSGTADRTLQRWAPQTPAQIVARMRSRRRRCNTCATPSGQQLTGSEPESSFGVPYRVSPVRRWMRALDAALAAANLPVPAGRPGTRADRERFVREAMVPAAAELGTEPPDYAGAFEREPWLHCGRDGACNGTIPYAEWAPWATRIDVCTAALNSLPNSDDFVVPMEICDLDSRLDAVCAAIQEARQLVATGNCIAAGACVTAPFFYSPSVFSVSNNDFVRMSVLGFYEQHDAEVCAADDATAALIEQNERLQAECASTYMERLKQGLLLLRGVVHLIARVSMYVFNMAIALFRLVLAGADVAAVVDEIIYWFNKLLMIIKDILVQLGNLVFKVLFELSSLGSNMEAVIRFLCEVVRVLLMVVHAVYCTIVRPMIGFFLDGINALVTAIEDVVNGLCLGTCNFELEALRTILDFIRDLLVDKTENFCANSFSMSCTAALTQKPENFTGALPVATRCWADFVPVAGASFQLACTRADTCRAEALSGVTVACDKCPLQDGVAFNDFGCDLLLKQCMCKTQHRSITYCTQNDQCSLDASCLMVDEPFASSSWGVDLCRNCRLDNAICMYDGSENLGRCGCTYRRLPLEQCFTSGTPNYNPAKDCLFTFASVQRVSELGYMSMGSLAVVPCAVLKPTKVVCAVVEGSGAYVVGYELLDSLSGVAATASRRLLALNTFEFLGPNASAAHDELAAGVLRFADWNGTADPCRSLVLAHRLGVEMGVGDMHALRGCVFWRTVLAATPGVPDTMLLSLEDFLTATARDVTAPLRLLRALRPLVHNVLAGWPEARAVVHALRPWLTANASWVSAVRLGARWVHSQHAAVAAFAQQHAQLSAVGGRRHLLSYSLDDLAELGISVEEAEQLLAELGVDIKFLENGDLDLSGIDATLLPPATLSLLEEAGVDVLQLEPDEIVVLHTAPVAVVSSRAVADAVGANEDLTRGMQLFPAQAQRGAMPGDEFPPPFEYWVDSDGDGALDADTCPAVAVLLEEIVDGVRLLQRYYRDGYYRLPLEQRSLFATLPAVAAVGTAVADDADAGADAGFSASVMRFARSVLAMGGITRASLVALLTCTDERAAHFSLCNAIRDVLVCDVEAVQLCTRHTRDTVLSAVFIAVLFLLLGKLLNALGLGVAKIALWLSYASAVMWYSFGYSPACIPLVPTCLLEEVLIVVYTMFPREMHVPADLQTAPGCWADDAVPAAACFRSCVTDPRFNFASPTAALAWGACEVLGPASCSGLRAPLELPPLWSGAEFERDVAQKSAAWFRVQGDGDWDGVTAQRVCATVGLAVLMPYALLLTAAIVVALALLMLPLALLYAATNLAVQLLFFTHVRAAGRYLRIDAAEARE